MHHTSDGSTDDGVCHLDVTPPNPAHHHFPPPEPDELRQTRQALRLSEARLESLLRIIQHKFTTAQELIDFALEEGILLTGSRIGFIHCYDEESRRFTRTSWSREVMEECRLGNQPPSPPLEQTGMWGEAVRQRRPVIVNDFRTPHPSMKGYPEGHARLRRFMSIPVFSGGGIVAAMAVANKGIDYDDSDVRQLTLLMDTVWKIVQQKRTEEEHRESEQRFRTIFETSQAGIILMDFRGVITFANRRMAEMFGCDMERLIGSPYVEHLHPTEREEGTARLQQWLNSKQERGVAERRYLRGSDEEFWGYLSLKRLEGVDGELQSLVGIITDISDRRLAEDSRNRALSFVEALLAQSPLGIRIFDGETGDCVLANRAAAEIAAGNEPNLLKQNFRTLASWRGAGIAALAEAVLTDGKTRRIETELHTSFGDHKRVEYFLSSFVVDGKSHLVVTGRDVTEERRLEEENRRIEAQMLHVQKLESLGVLAGGIAHDFNNILTAVLGNADLAMMQLPPSSPARKNILRIEQAAGKAAELARQMLAYSGKGHFVVEKLDLNVLIEEMTQMLEVSLSKRADLHFDLTRGLPAIDADATQLQQVIMNLVINASEAICHQNGAITIATGVQECDRACLAEMWIDEQLPEGTYVVLEVSDNGCGMDRETAAKIFEPFFTTKFSGRGLGMAVTLGIVRGHRGAISLHSQPGKGTTFRILLPASDRLPARDGATPQAEEGWRGCGTVLLVDDEESIRFLGAEMLSLLGFRALTAADGLDALTLFRDQRADIDCVILDLTMPRLDGEQTFLELRRIDPLLPVIMCSGYSELDVVERFVAQGLAGFIQKPYKLSDLEHALKAALGTEPTDAESRAGL